MNTRVENINFTSAVSSDERTPKEILFTVCWIICPSHVVWGSLDRIINFEIRWYAMNQKWSKPNHSLNSPK